MPDYSYWENALKGEFGPVHEGEANPGFWRKRVESKGAFVPAAIWEDNGVLVATLDGKDADPAEIWGWVCRYPVSEEFYRQRVATGRWPDEDEAMAASLKAPPAYQGMGANNPPTDPWQVLHEQIDIALKGVQDYGKIDSDEAAGKAQGLRSRLLELSGKADKEREALKRPITEAGKKIDATWQPLVKDAKGGADSLRAAISAHETRQFQARQEVERRQTAISRRQAEEITGGPVHMEVVPAPEPIKTQVRGAYGKAASKTVIKIAKVVDYDKAFQSLKTHPELKALIDNLAQRAVKAGITPDGVEVEEQIDVR